MRKGMGCVLLALVWCAGLAADPLKIGVIQELGPFAPAVARVFEDAGIQADVIPEPTARLMADLRLGQLDGGFLFSEPSVSGIPDIKKVPVALYQNDYIAVTARKDLKIRSSADLAGLRVGYVRGNQTFERFLKQAPTAVGQDVTDMAQVFKLLGGGRVDVILTTASSLLIFGALAEKQLFAQEPPLLSVPMYMVLSNRVEGQLPVVTAAFERVVGTGAWSQIIKNAFDIIRAQSSKP